MSAPPDDDNLRDQLTALADGELDAAQASAVWESIAAHPDRVAALTWLRDQQRLTVAAGRVARSSVPHEFRVRIEETLADATAAAPAEGRGRPRTHDSRRRRLAAGLALAAALAIGYAAAFVARPSSAAAPLPANYLIGAERIHSECSRLPTGLHDAAFEATNANVASLVQADLGSSTATPDLRSAGFAFVGAGPCPASRLGTVHLLYHSTRPRSLATASVFVQPDSPTFRGLEVGRVYRVSATTSPFPALAWRTSRAAYLLVTDDDAAAYAVLQSLHPTPAQEIVTLASR